MYIKTLGFVLVVITFSILYLSKNFLPASHAATSKYAYLGNNGKLEYLKDSRGNIIPDFSHAGYWGGGVRIPEVPTVKTISPVSGDNTSHVQNAINAVGNLPVQSNGFRGALLLKKGTYNISGNLSINKSGIVLRGEGDSNSGTVIKGTGTGTRTLIQIDGKNDKKEISGTRQNISDNYVPVGARSFNIPDGSKFKIGDKVEIYRPATQNWLDALGMDDCYKKGSNYDTADVRHKSCLDPAWTTEIRKIYFDRIITRIEGNKITIDAPITNSLDKEFGGGYIYKYDFPGRIENVGIEYLRGDSTYTSSTDENHTRRFIYLRNIQNAWIKNVTAIHFYHGVMMAWDNSKWITVQDSKTLDPVSQITGERRYPFDISRGQMVLVQRCYSYKGRHDFVTGADTSGPNVFLDCIAENSYNDVGPHQRYATGTLYDNVKSDWAIRALQRNIYYPGNSHGWAGMQQVFWNCETPTHIVMSPDPKLGTNWSIGCIANKREQNGIYDSFGTHVTPRSLYLQQLKDRLGQDAVDNISKNPPSITNTPIPTTTKSPSITSTLIKSPTPTSKPAITPTTTQLPNTTITTKPTSSILTSTPRPSLSQSPTKKPTNTLAPTKPKPTLTEAPTATFTPGRTTVNISMLLQGIGSAGGHLDPNNSSLSNKNPLREKRQATIEIYDQNNKKLTESTGIIKYNKLTGDFTGSIEFKNSIPSGNYNLVIKSPSYSEKKVPGVINLNLNRLNYIPRVALNAGDADNDNSLSIFDYSILYGCYSVLKPPKSCTDEQRKSVDFNDDGAVNQFDYILFLRNIYEDYKSKK